MSTASNNSPWKSRLTLTGHNGFQWEMFWSLIRDTGEVTWVSDKTIFHGKSRGTKLCCFFGLYFSSSSISQKKTVFPIIRWKNWTRWYSLEFKTKTELKQWIDIRLEFIRWLEILLKLNDSFIYDFFFSNSPGLYSSVWLWYMIQKNKHRRIKILWITLLFLKITHKTSKSTNVYKLETSSLRF